MNKWNGENEGVPYLRLRCCYLTLKGKYTHIFDEYFVWIIYGIIISVYKMIINLIGLVRAFGLVYPILRAWDLMGRAGKETAEESEKNFFEKGFQLTRMKLNRGCEEDSIGRRMGLL